MNETQDHRGGERSHGNRSKGRSSDKKNHDHHDSRGRSRYGNSDSFHREDRERSRDRHDGQRGPLGNPQNFQHQYDPRRASQIVGGVPPPPPSHPPYGQQQQQQMQFNPYQPQPQQQQPPSFGMPNGVVLPYQQQQPLHQSPHLAFVPDQQQHQPLYMNQPHMAHQQPLPQFMMGQQGPTMTTSQIIPHNSWQPSSQQQSSAPPDIIGIADKAAQALAAAMGHLSSQPQQSPLLYGTPQQGMQQQQQQQQQQHYGGPIYQQNMQQQQPNLEINAMQGMMQPQQPLQIRSKSYSTNQQQVIPPTKRRHIVAQIHELSLSVQQAVHNLHATGAIDGALDEGILGMIKDLPEPLALQSLQKFSAMDHSSMRSKTVSKISLVTLIFHFFPS